MLLRSLWFMACCSKNLHDLWCSVQRPSWFMACCSKTFMIFGGVFRDLHDLWRAFQRIYMIFDVVLKEFTWFMAWCFKNLHDLLRDVQTPSWFLRPIQRLSCYCTKIWYRLLEVAVYTKPLMCQEHIHNVLYAMWGTSTEYHFKYMISPGWLRWQL